MREWREDSYSAQCIWTLVWLSNAAILFKWSFKLLYHSLSFHDAWNFFCPCYPKTRGNYTVFSLSGCNCLLHEVLFKKRSGVYYQVKKLLALPRGFKPNNTWLQVFWTVSKSLINSDQLILALIFRFGVILVSLAMSLSDIHVKTLIKH